MEKLVSDASKLLMQVLMTDSKVSAKILDNANDAEKYKICTIQDNGTIVLGKTSVRWWNQLLGCQDKIPFDSFALKVWDALVDLSSGLNNKAILNGLSIEVVKKSVRTKDYDYVVRRLYDCWAHVAQKSEGYQKALSPEGGPGSAQDCPGGTFASDKPREIVININGTKKTIPFIDSNGDPLNIGLDYGFLGFRNL